jgi:homoserine acetyltransferase
MSGQPWECLFSALLITTGARHSLQNIALHEVSCQAVMADPD